jgi:predicted alpha/beta hydrolase family esterase
MSPSSTIERIVIVHGMNSDPTRHWIPSLTSRLQAAGVTVDAPTLPDSSEPDAKIWASLIEAAVGDVDGRTAIVAHSLGAAAVLRFLSNRKGPWQLGALVTVGGFFEPLPGRHSTTPFTENIDLDGVRRNTAVRKALVSTNDSVVPPEVSTRLAERLDADVIAVSDAGHFRDSDGVTRVSELEDILLALVTTPSPTPRKA